MRLGLAGRTEGRARLFGGCLVGFTGTWNVANIGAVAIPLSHHYHASLATIGLFTTANFLGEVAAMLPAGILIDRFGAKRVGLAAMAVCAVGNVALMLPTGVVAAVLIRWLVGLGGGATFIAGSAYVRTAGQSSLFQGLYGGVSLSAGGLALAIVPQLSGPLGWRAPYASALALALVALVVVGACPPTARHEHSAEPVSMAGLALDRRLVRLGMLSAAGFGISVIVGNWAPTLLSRTHGYDKGTAGAIAGLTILLGIVGRPAGGVVARHWPRATRALIACAFLGGAVATALLAVGGPLALLAIEATVIGIAAGTPFGPIMFGATRVYPQAPGAAIGAMNVWPAAAIVAATPLIGLTFQLPGDGRIGFAVLAVLWALAARAIPPSSALS
jgi:MFS family permease